MSGLEVARELRRQRVRTPILRLTARDAVYDRVCGLDSGADDYLTKPFALEELLARVRALGRRKSEESSIVLRVGDLVLDLERRMSSRAERPLDLTTQEFDVLAYLMRNAGRVLGKDVILARVWGHDSDAGANAVELYVHHLRQKVDRGFARPLIRTVRGVGYTIRP